MPIKYTGDYKNDPRMNLQSNCFLLKKIANHNILAYFCFAYNEQSYEKLRKLITSLKIYEFLNVTFF